LLRDFRKEGAEGIAVHANRTLLKRTNGRDARRSFSVVDLAAETVTAVTRDVVVRSRIRVRKATLN